MIDHFLELGVPEDGIDVRALTNFVFSEALPISLRAAQTKRFAIISENWHVPKHPGVSDERHRAEMAAWDEEHGPDSLGIHPRRRECLPIMAFDPIEGAIWLQSEIKRVGKRNKPRLMAFKVVHHGAITELGGRIPGIARFVFADHEREESA